MQPNAISECIELDLIGGGISTDTPAAPLRAVVEHVIETIGGQTSGRWSPPGTTTSKWPVFLA